MSIQRIEHEGCRSYGYQVRVHVVKGHPRLTRYFADGAHGGPLKAHSLAKIEELRLKVQADRQRKRLRKAGLI